MRSLLLFLIRCYQVWLSPWLGGCCRFEPSCSEYAASAIRGHGAIGGVWLTLKRLVRCHPLHPGGWDPVPPPLFERTGEPVDDSERRERLTMRNLQLVDRSRRPLSLSVLSSPEKPGHRAQRPDLFARTGGPNRLSSSRSL